MYWVKSLVKAFAILPAERVWLAVKLSVLLTIDQGYLELLF
jgi:hypothetical protein